MSFINQKVPKPVTKGYVNVPMVMQMEELECGAAALAMIMHYYRNWLTLEQARIDCGVSMDGVNAKNILLAARSYGLIAKGWNVEAENLKNEGPFPCIIHWSLNHFVVLCGFSGDKAVINDPARGHIKIDWEEFDKEYSGVCLFFEPGDNFSPAGKPKSVFSYAKKYLSGSATAITFVILTTTVLSLLNIAKPFFSRIFLDNLLSGANPEWLNPFMLLFVLFALISIIVGWITAVYSLRIEGRMAIQGSSSYLWKVLHLPMQFFAQRHSADIADRQTTNASIANTLVQSFAPLAIQTLLMIFYLIIMIRYSLILSLIGVSAIILNLLVSAWITNKRINLTRIQQRDEANLSSATMSGLSMIETIKASGAENGFFGRWAGYQAKVNNQAVRFSRLNNIIGYIPYSITTITNVLVLGIGVFLVLQGKFTAGMVMAFQGFMSSFMYPATSIINAGQSIQEMISQMERVDDVISYPEDSLYSNANVNSNNETLSGSLELKNVTFGYNRLGNPVIKDFTMSINPGQKIAVVGPTGCGKSTLIKLISGLYKPWNGTITFDGKPIDQINRDIFIRSICVIDQNNTIFEDTISQNIRLWDETISDLDVIKASKDAGIYDEIISREDGFSHILSDGGPDLSGGQRQRLEIARALARNPKILIMDEATSQLDSKSENGLVSSITSRGITCIIVAHRLSTIRDCDEILVLNKGQIVECGTHNELYDKNGFYTQLVISE